MRYPMTRWGWGGLVQTDFEEHGLATGRLAAGRRQFALTLDFEAFSAEMVPLWVAAMRVWADEARSSHIPVSVFVSLEDLVQLRYEDPDEYETFVKGVRMLSDSGAAFYPHNHRVFDPITGG